VGVGDTVDEDGGHDRSAYAGAALAAPAATSLAQR
jgi:hypothetical protein